jgi:hypothetical protein
MSTIEEKLEELFARVRALPQDRQQRAVVALAEIADEDVYVLSDDELKVLEPALKDAELGENLVDLDADELLNKPWG